MRNFYLAACIARFHRNPRTNGRLCPFFIPTPDYESRGKSQEIVSDSQTVKIICRLFNRFIGVQAQTALAVYGGNAQHTANYLPAAQNLNAVRWSVGVDLGSVDAGNGGTSTHCCAPVISAANTVFVPVKTAGNGLQINAISGNTGVSIYTLSTDYIVPGQNPPGQNPVPSYSPTLATGPTGSRLYYAGAGGSVYYVENPDSRPASAPVQQVFYGLSSYQANRAGFNSSVFINTPITTDNNGDIFFGFAVQGTAPAPLSTTQSGFARIDPSGRATYVLAGLATGDSNIGRDSRNSAPALSNDQTTLYVLAKAANSESYGYLLGLDSATLETRYRTVLRDPVSGNYAAIWDGSAASPMIAPDGDVYLGVTDPQDSQRGFLLHFSADLSLEKVPGAPGRDFTPAIVPATMVPSYKGSSSYLIFSRYNDSPGEDGGRGVNRIVLLDPNSTQLDPHPSARSLPEMREVLSAGSVTPDTYRVAAGFPLAVSEWSAGTAAVNPATSAIYVSNADGHIYRWDPSANSLSQSVPLATGHGDAYASLAIGPDGAIYTINAGSLFAAGDATGTGIGLKSSSPDLRNAVAGDAVAFTAAVVSSPGAEVVASGTVTFRDTSFQNGAPLSVTLGTAPVDATGHASMATSSLQAGAHFITASYNGSANAVSAATVSATLVQLIHASATAVTLASSLSSSDRERGRGAATTLTATVTPLSALISGVPSGMVAFTDENDNVVAQIPLSAGAASFSITAPRAGTRITGAVYSSDGTFAASAGTLTAGSSPGSSRTPAADSPATAISRAAHPLASTGGALSGIGDYSQNAANLTLEGTADWIHWGDSCTNQKASAGSASVAVSQLKSLNVIGSFANLPYNTDARPLSWTDGYRTSTPCTTLPVSSDSYPNGNTNGLYVSGANNGFSFTAPADTSVRTLVVHAGGFFAAGQLTAHLSDGSAADFVDTTPVTSRITASYDRNYVLTYKAASASQTLTVSWVEVTDLGTGSAPGNVDLSAAALSLFTGTIAPVSGAESAAVNTAFTPPLQVTVTAANGSPVSGVTVTFTAPAGPSGPLGTFASGTAATAVTGSNGIASAPTFTANSKTGSYYVTASVPAVANTAEFVLTNTAGPPVSITTVPNPAVYSAVVNTAYTTALQALVKDFNGNPVSGATVTFSDTPASGQPGALFATGTAASAVTNAFGIAFAPKLTANSFQGTYNVGATVAGVTAYYLLDNTAGGNGFLVAAGNNSSASVNLTATGTSDWIHWGDSSLNRKASGGSQISDFSSVSTVFGPDRTPGPARSAPAGAQSVEQNDSRLMSWSDGAPTAASSGNGNGALINFATYTMSGTNGFTFTAPADLTMRTLTVYVGGNNSGGTLVAHLSDASAPDFVDTTATNTSGYDRNYTLTYSAASALQSLTITWTMTSGAGNVTLSGAAVSLGVPLTITAVTSTTPQSAVVTTAFGTPLQAKVVDANGSALSGVIVTFVAPAAGASATFSNGSFSALAATDSTGVATSPALSANGVSGTYTAVAALAGEKAPAMFSLTNLIPGGSMSGSVADSAGTTANLTTAGTLDWVHWGTALIHKSGVSPQIGNNYNYTAMGPGTQSTYTGDSRKLSWSDGTPTPSSTDDSGVYIPPAAAQQGGYSFTGAGRHHQTDFNRLCGWIFQRRDADGASVGSVGGRLRGYHPVLPDPPDVPD